MADIVTEKQKQIEDIITYSQNCDFDINCADISKTWYAHKLKFINMFGGTVWRSPSKIEISLSSMIFKSAQVLWETIKSWN